METHEQDMALVLEQSLAAAKLVHEQQAVLRDAMSSAAINDLPDDAFAYIEPGGEKDSEGKTTPRSLRHFPVQDEAHARNALAQAPKSPFGEKAMPKILAACKKFGVAVEQQNSVEAGVEMRAKCATCDGSGKIMDGHRTCPDCKGTGTVPEKQSNSDRTSLSRRKKRERHRAIPLMPEVRHFRATGLEVRSSSDTDEIVISGSPIVYDTPYTVCDMFGEFEERMARGVASDILDQADVRLLLNHDGLPLARTAAGTMSLKDTPEALRFVARLDARQQLANDLAIAIERGDVSQMSCGFIVGRDEWDESMENRTIFRLADLLDVSAVTYPASPTTSIAVAQRMALSVPVESRARLRQMCAEVRAGKVLSDANQGRLVDAVKTLHSVLGSSGYDVNDLVDGQETAETAPDDEEIPASGDAEPDGSQGLPDEDDIASPTYQDGSGVRSIVDPGDGIRARKTSRALRVELEARKRRRVAA